MARPAGSTVSTSKVTVRAISAPCAAVVTATEPFKALTGLNVLGPHVFVAASHLASALGWHPESGNTGLAEAGQAPGG